ncbi:insulin-like growth factor-binding protein complex acid labile subunit [Drosophila novamexicana]|uniref:insulin-like growth factor-binding protein complex acid labile subunit n=1 Tax=Drosophila novamexicana TaxID=47314 RepID=UPI0011E5FF60|nr:insulin-like growth factor-binding protein complex acid labile subunit [Drosophila novamexicana]
MWLPQPLLLSLVVCTVLRSTIGSASGAASPTGGQLRRIWLQDHCTANICTGVEIGRNDYVILSQAPIAKQLMLTFINSSIAKIPHLMFDTFPDLQLLRMENCTLETFEKPQFEGASNLMSLFLGHNRLKDIPKNIFLGADNLATLHLENNLLKVLHNHSFHALKELKDLSLADNQLEQLPLGVFAGLRKLLDLNLAGNRLRALPRGIFDKNLNMTRLSLARNLLATFESEILKLQPRLTLLDISGNILHELTLNFSLLEQVLAHSCDLRRLTVYGVIRELDLHNNSLRELPHIPLASNVTSLDLSQNPLGNLQGNPLRRFTALLRLNLSATNTHELAEGLFKKQTHLQMLDISANTIYSLKITLFDSLKALQYFYFQQNNWNCDFLQLLMSSFVKKRDISFMEDLTAPELVDDYVDGIACWYESDKISKKCDGANSEAALELSIVRNEIKAFTELVDKKFVRVYRMLEEMKLKL